MSANSLSASLGCTSWAGASHGGPSPCIVNATESCPLIDSTTCVKVASACLGAATPCFLVKNQTVNPETLLCRERWGSYKAAYASLACSSLSRACKYASLETKGAPSTVYMRPGVGSVGGSISGHQAGEERTSSGLWPCRWEGRKRPTSAEFQAIDCIIKVQKTHAYISSFGADRSWLL